MQAIQTSKDLQEAILTLQTKKILQEEALKAEAHQLLENLKPGNLISNALKQPEVRSKVFNTSMALAAGYVTKRILLGPASGPVTNIAGGILQWGVTAIAGKKFSGLKQKLGNLIRKAKI
ncbi:MAG: hypothetical protein M3O67_04165 [Bacteroidota bacterium]|nr:hypothetical protein [Bacteroidota bacterium]